MSSRRQQAHFKNALRRTMYLAGEGPMIDIPPVDYFEDQPKKDKKAVTLPKLKWMEKEKDYVSNADII